MSIINKIFLAAIFCIGFSYCTNAQTTNTLLKTLNTDSLTVGWFAQVQYKNLLTSKTVTQENIHHVGGRFGVTIDRKFSLGFYGYAKVSKFHFASQQNTYGLGYGIGGIYGGVSPFYTKIVHPSVSISMGYGGALEYIYNNGRGATLNTVGFLHCEPELGFEINISKSTRLSVSGSYRFIQHSNFHYASEEVLNGYFVNMGLIVGRF